ncbi:MAG: phosphoserine phosphatase SerB [Boseongicola sp. SB0675_bin_26]|nr:phosphoserine phosphatase SerB [Boseongicola sp. SB0675_bin_26]
MPVISLIAPRRHLDPALVSSLQGAFGATGDAVWLAPDEAAEFPVAARPGNLDEVRAGVADQAVDLNFIDDGDRRKSLLIADMDMTMIGQECIDELAAEAGVGEEVASITVRAMNGELDFADAVAERVGLMKGLSVRAIEHVLETRITLAPGGGTLVQTMKAHGARTALVSGGFVQFAARVGKLLGFDDVHANALLVENGRLTGGVKRPVLGRDAKVEVLNRLSPDASRAIAIGDGANDLGMITRAGMGVAMHAKPVVAIAAPLRIDHADLTACLFLQGYSIEEFS